MPHDRPIPLGAEKTPGELAPGGKWQQAEIETEALSPTEARGLLEKELKAGERASLEHGFAERSIQALAAFRR
jgi:hypothetical protein